MSELSQQEIFSVQNGHPVGKSEIALLDNFIPLTEVISIWTVAVPVLHHPDSQVVRHGRHHVVPDEPSDGAVVAEGLGANSIDIMNLGHETGHETGPRAGTNSVLGHKFRYVSKLQQEEKSSK